MTKARDIADGAVVDTSAFLTSASALDPANLDSTGTIPSALLAGVGGGKVLQVLSASTTTATSTSNSNLQDTDLALNITPTSATSKIFIQVVPQLLAESASNAEAGLGFGISREIDGANNTTVFETTHNYDGAYISGGGNSSDRLRIYPSVAHLDSPNTTGVCRYKFRIKAYSGNAVLSESGGKSQIFLFEIAA